MHVLIVDDEQMIRQVLERMLSAAGYAVRSFGHPAEALDAVRNGTPADVLVTDRRMPGMTGEELVSELRCLLAINVLYVSGLDDEPAVASAHASSTAYLRKPFSRTELLKKVSTLTAVPAADPRSRLP